MARKLADVIADLPVEEREAIARETGALLKEEMALRDLRRALKLSQAQLAQALGVGQASVAKLERRTDVYVSSLRRFIEAMGGELEIVARFPEGSVRVTNFAEIDEDGDTSAAVAAE